MVSNIQNNRYMPKTYVPTNGALPKKEQIKGSVSANVTENPMVKASGGLYNPRVAAGTLFLWPALMAIVQPINKAISGDYKNSLLGKIGNFGDRIFNSLKLDKVINEKNTSRITNFITTNKLTKYFTSDYAAKPTNSLARAIGTKSELAQDAISVIKEIQTKNPNLDLSGFFNSKMLTDFGLNGQEVLKNADPVDYIDDLTVGLQNMIKHCKDSGIPEGFNIGLRNISLSELRNKLISIAPNETKRALEKAGIDTTNMVSSTPLGKEAAKGTLRTLEGLTNGMAGGPLGTVMQAFCFAQAIHEAKEAPKGEKLSTFMHVVVSDLGSYLLFVTSRDIVYKIAGNRYRGMTKEGIKAFREFIAQANASDLSKEAMKIAKAQRKLFLKGVSPDTVRAFGETAAKNPSAFKTAMKEAMQTAPKLKFWERPLKSLGNLITTGMETIKPQSFKNIAKSDGFLGNIMRKIQNAPQLSGFLGGALRFILVTFVVAPIILKPFMKLCHLIFGTPTTYLNKDKGENTKQSTLNETAKQTEGKLSAAEMIQRHNQNSLNRFALNTAESKASDKNKNNYQAANPLSKTTPIRHYIPSTEPAQFTNAIDEKVFNDLMSKSNTLEKEAMSFLK